MVNAIVWLIVGAMLGWIASQLTRPRSCLLLNLVEREQTFNQLLVEMDGFDDVHDIVVLPAIDRPDVLDPRLLWPGWFDRRVTVILPDRPGREANWRIGGQGLHLAPDVELSSLARTTAGVHGADLPDLCHEAPLVAARLQHCQTPDNGARNRPGAGQPAGGVNDHALRHGQPATAGATGSIRPCSGRAGNWTHTASKHC